MARTDAQDILTGNKEFNLQPVVPSGIIFGEKRKGLISVVESTPETINHVANPSFMIGEYPWSEIDDAGGLDYDYRYTAVNSSTDHTYANKPECHPENGGWLRIEPTDGGDAGIFCIVALPEMGDYTFSCFVAGKPTHTFQVYVTDNTGTKISGVKEVRGNGNWQRVHITFHAPSNASYRLYLIRKATSSNPTQYFFTSFWQCEDNGFLTLPFNGNTKEKGISSIEYKWIYTEWRSKSKRSERTMTNGVERFLKDYGFNLERITGLGASGITHVLEPLSTHGSVWNNTKVKSRQFSLKGTIVGRTYEERLENEQAINALLSQSGKASSAQPLTLIFRVFNEDDNSIIEGQTLYIYCRYDGGVATSSSGDTGVADVTLNFTLDDPFLYSSMQKEYNFNTARETIESGASQAIFLTYEDEQFTSISDITVDAAIYAMCRSKTGEIFIGGDNIGEAGTGLYYPMVKYNENTGDVTVFDNFLATVITPIVYDLHPLPDGRIVVVGDFLAVDGLGSGGGGEDCFHVALYDPVGDSWTNLSLPGAAKDNSSYAHAVDVDQFGRLYVTGYFANDVCLYILGGDDDYASCTWSIAGYFGYSGDKGYDVILFEKQTYAEYQEPDVYICGDFDSVGDAVTNVPSYNIGYYAGLSTRSDSQWTLLNEQGLDDVAYKMVIARDGMMYISGDFNGTHDSNVSSKTLIKYNFVQFMPIDFPGNTGNNFSTIAIDVDRAGTLHILRLIDYMPSYLDYTEQSADFYWTFKKNVFTVHPIAINIDFDGSWVAGPGKIFIWYDEMDDKMWLSVENPYENDLGPTTTTEVSIINTFEEIENNGVEIYPTIKFIGPGKIFNVVNKTTHKKIMFSQYNIKDKEVLTLDLENYGEDIITLKTNRVNRNLTKMINLSSDLDFSIVPGTNRIGVLWGAPGSDCFVKTLWREKYLTISNIINYRDII